MHSLFFDTKRAHRATLKLMNPLLARVEPGLTQARYDVMHAMSFCEGRRANQSALWKLLGVHPSTMCKLVRALLALGFVERTRVFDRRQWRVTLTELGWRVLVRARRFLGRFVARSVVVALTTCWPTDFVTVRLHFEGLLGAFRGRFGDTASLAYEPGWQPYDDC